MSNSYTDYGQQTADMLLTHLTDDIPVSEMPVERGKDYDIVVNEVYDEAIGIYLSILDLNRQIKIKFKEREQ